MECEQELKCLFSQVIGATEHVNWSLPRSQKPTMRTLFDARLHLNLERVSQVSSATPASADKL
jgi:hypothetical protein